MRAKHLHVFVLIDVRNKGKFGTAKTLLSPPVVLLTVQGCVSFVDLFLLLFVFVCIYHAVLSTHCSLVATNWEQAGLLALLHVLISLCFVTFHYGSLGKVNYLIVSIPHI